ncbi:putative long-chain-fatty-acid--CoA ligase [Helianthus annuus]|nr:putative long-chain-fatty-acid--CoA ligase [Helianthus annuus]
MSSKKFIVQVEPAVAAKDGHPSKGPVYRSVFAKNGFPAPVDGLESCWDIFRLSVEKYPNNPMLGTREFVNGKHGAYKWLTYKQVYDKVIRVGNAIRACGVEPKGRCGIYGANCAEWVMSMEACNAHGLYCVPLYDTLGADAIEFVICHAEVTIAFVEEKKISELIKVIPKAREYLKTIVSFGKVTREQREQVENFGLKIHSWVDFLSLDDGKNIDMPLKKKSDICTIMYTSGTTGDPKGVLISNNNMVTLIAGVDHLLDSAKVSLNSQDVYLSFLPLAHIFDRLIEECFISHGASIGFWRGDVKLLIEDIGELKPTIFCAVPRVLDRIYSGLQQKISAGGFIKRKLFNLAYSHKLRNMNAGKEHSKASPLSDKIVFSKVKQGLGGRVRIILSGAAPLAPHVEAYLKVVTCSHVLQGYGLTETCAGSFVSLPNEMDMLGYHKREDLTKEVLVDGWFHTGDIGEWQPDGSMKIIDRKKNIFKLSQGEYVAVENLENIYGLVPDIDAVWIYGNSFESCLVAVVNPNQQAIEHYAKAHNISGDFNSLCENPKIKEYIMGELTRIGKEKKLKGFEFMKAIHLDPVPFDMERDLLTPTFKKKRPQMLKYYQNVIDNMYKTINKK